MYEAYVYIWFDTKSKFFYIGGHKGKVEDYYISSSKTMMRAYNKRPETFKMRVLEYVKDATQLRLAEQKWLDMIKDHELMISENVKHKTCRYYNVKKQSTGGNGKGTNKGKKTGGGWNKGMKMSADYCAKLSRAQTGKTKSEKHKQNIKISKERNNYSNGISYELISPNGEIFITNNLNRFCRDHNLNQGNMYMVIIGKHISHKQWKGRKVSAP